MDLRYRATPFLVPFLLAVASCSTAAGGQPVPPFERVERPAFDGDAAFALLERQVAFGPRVAGRPGHAAQLAWMREWLAERADTVEERPFTHLTEAGDTLRLTNLLARFRPELHDRVLLLAHWDTRPLADQAARRADRDQPVPGANDGASGTAVLLHLAELFRGQAPPLGVDLLLLDGEDFGPRNPDMFLGSRHFAAHLDGYRPRYGILLDMVGDRDLRLAREGYSLQFAPEVVERVWGLARAMGHGGIFVDGGGDLVYDDHVPISQAGIPTIDLIDFEYGPDNRYWHTPDDVVHNISPESLRVVGDVVAELIYRGG